MRHTVVIINFRVELGAFVICDRKIIHDHITFCYQMKHDDIFCNVGRCNHALNFFLQIKYCVLFNERTLNFSVGGGV